MQALTDDVDWIQKEVVIMGRKVMQPRLICYMADDPSLTYRYSGADMVVNKWDPSVLALKVRSSVCHESMSSRVVRLSGCVEVPLTTLPVMASMLSWHPVDAAF